MTRACVFAGLMVLELAGLLLGGRLAPEAAGVPADLGGEAVLEQRGSHLWMEARLPETGGKVLARSIGRNPVWERDVMAAPPVEDRIEWRIRYRGVTGTQREIVVEGNPWGAYVVSEGGEVLPAIRLERTAEITPDGWTYSAALPLAHLDVDWKAPEVRWEAVRIRSRRPMAPEFRWKVEGGAVALKRIAEGSAPAMKPLRVGNQEAPLEVGWVPRLPSVVASWEDPAWSGAPAFELPRNDSHGGAPRYRTEVKWMHDGRTLALLARMTEPEPVVARAGGRDSAVTGDDHLGVYLAVSGSAYVEVALNTVGAIRDALGKGPRMAAARTQWDAKIERQTEIRHGYWVARVNIPLDECAAALGESGVPGEWRVLLIRHRAARPGEVAEWSSLPTMKGRTGVSGPGRYRRLLLRNSDPASVRMPEAVKQPQSELARMDAHVWSAPERRYRAVRTMVEQWQQKRVEQEVWKERAAWENVRSRADWEAFREERIKRFRQAVGQLPAESVDLRARTTGRHEGNGYRLENVVYQVRPDYWMPANFYLPAKGAGPFPAIVVVHSQHYPKTQGELHDMGELWARVGCAVLVIERPGFGERVETTPWYRQAYASRYNYTKQLFLVGESGSGWAAWDVIRSIDYLYARPEVDKQKIVLLGSVAGGGEIAGVAAALDERITAVAPFNFDQGHLRVHGDTPGQIAGQFSPWLVAASVAPRKFIRAFEFGWEGAEEPDYPRLWFDGMERSRRVWQFYGAADNLRSSQAYGLIRLSMERVSHCFSIGPQQRLELYAALERWFGVPYPSKEDLAILPDSELSVNPVREEARRQELTRRRPLAELTSITPEVSAGLRRRATWELAREMGARYLDEARTRRRALGKPDRIEQLRTQLATVLGDIEPADQPRVEVRWLRQLGWAEVDAVSLTVEDGISVPMLVIRPAGRKPTGVVVSIAQEGKSRFLEQRGKEIEALVRAGFAVCLPDVRGTGETAPTAERIEGGAYQRIAQTEFDLGKSLLGARLKDLRTVLKYLRGRQDLNGRPMAVWGESFAEPNPAGLWVDELENEGSPQIQVRAEPLGAHLALLAALYEEGVRAVAARGGLAGYLTVLDAAFAYVPFEDTLLGVLKAGDVADIVGAISPRAALLDGLVNGRNIRVEGPALERTLDMARAAYREAGASAQLQFGGDVGAWIAAAMSSR